MYDKIITFGTFDLFHIGHVNLFKKAKRLGNHLIVGVSTDNCNKEKGKKSIIKFYDRLNIIKNSESVNEVFAEESLDLKVHYIEKYKPNALVMGDDWKGKFDYLKKYGIDVIYLKRTPDIDSTLIKKKLSSKEQLWIIFLYKQYLHEPLDKYFQYIFDKYSILINPDWITYCSLFIFPIIFYLQKYIIICSTLCIIHDLLDRMDGSMARLYNHNNIPRNHNYGEHIDALCDKIYFILMSIFIVKFDWIILIKCVIHIISFFLRYYIYYYKLPGKSTINGKFSTFLENISFCLYFTNLSYLSSFCMFSSIFISIQSLYEKINNIISFS